MTAARPAPPPAEPAAPSGRLVDDFSLLCEGDVDPSLGKRIRVLVFRDPRFIVYLDDALHVQWALHDAGGDALPEDGGTVLNRATHLETLSMALLPRREWPRFRRLLAEGIARLLDEGSTDSAGEILARAELRLLARSRERARLWLLVSAAVPSVAAAALGLAGWVLRGELIAQLGAGAHAVALASLGGAVGALLSVISRSTTLPADVEAGLALHVLDGFGRVVVGVAGAFLVAVAVKADLVLGLLTARSTPEQGLALLLALGTLAGASERLVPSLIARVEDLGAPGRGGGPAPRQERGTAG